MLREKRNLHTLRITRKIDYEIQEGLKNYTNLVSLELLHTAKLPQNNWDSEGKEWSDTISGCINLRYLDLSGIDLIQDAPSNVLASIPPHLIKIKFNDIEEEEIWEDDDEVMESMERHSFLCFIEGISIPKEVEKVLERNREKWRERIYWSCWCNAVGRYLLLGKCRIPREVLRNILMLVPFPEGTRVEKVVLFSENREFLGKTRKRDFVNEVYGWNKKWKFYSLISDTVNIVGKKRKREEENEI